MLGIVKLVGAAAICGSAVGVASLLLSREKDKVARKSAFVLKALNMATSQQTVCDLLGEPIETRRIKLERVPEDMDKQLRVIVPLQGSKDKGIMTIHARRKDEKERLKLYKLELSFNKVKGKRLVLLDLPGDETLDDGADEVEKPVEKKQPKPKPKGMFDVAEGPLPKGLDLKREVERRKLLMAANESQEAQNK